MATPPSASVQHATSSRSQEISGLVDFARSNYEENPSEALSALMHALTLNSGQASADAAMERIRAQLGPAEDIQRTSNERARIIIQELMNDESTLLHQRGKQHLLEQAMQDGSSVICSMCNGMVATARWEQHTNHWCPSLATHENSDNESQEDMMM